MLLPVHHPYLWIFSTKWKKKKKSRNKKTQNLGKHLIVGKQKVLNERLGNIQLLILTQMTKILSVI